LLSLAVAGTKVRVVDLKESYERVRTGLEVELGRYRDLVANIAQDYPARVVEEQTDVLKTELKERGRQLFLPFADLFRSHLLKFREAGELASQDILDDLRSLEQ